MALVDSRLGPGVLKLGATDYGTQISNVKLVPSHNTEDGTPTLGIPKPAPLVTTKWELSGTAIQDWEAKAGFVEYCRENNMAEVAFIWTPNNDKGVTFTGTCQVLAVEIGGDVATQTTTDFTFAVVGDVTRAEAAPTTTTIK